MFHNTANGATASALVYSISETAKLNHLRPYYYFKYILTELPNFCDEQGQQSRKKWNKEKRKEAEVLAGKELKGREKVVSKMTRDGLTEENLADGFIIPRMVLQQVR